MRKQTRSNQLWAKRTAGESRESPPPAILKSADSIRLQTILVELPLKTMLLQEHAISAPHSPLAAPLHFSRAAGAPGVAPVVSAFANRVNTALADSPHLAGRQLRIEAHAGRVRLHGVVNSYYQKQMAQEALRRLEGVSEIDNCLEVAWS